MESEVLVGPRVRLRPLALDDLEDFHAVWGDPQVIFWGASTDLAESRDRLQDFLERAVDGVRPSGWFAIVRLEDQIVLGDVVLEPASWDSVVAEIGWHVARDHQGQGYASEAARVLIEHAFAAGLKRVVAKILPSNTASLRVAQNVGLQRTGRITHAGMEHELWEASVR